MAEAAMASAGNAFVAELEARHLHPLWDRYQRITPIKPQPRDAPFIWRWRDIEPFLHRSVGEVSINDIERRALIMAHPAFGARPPPPARCSPPSPCSIPATARVRTATPARRSASPPAPTARSTIVDGRRCEMKAGDLILTPPMVLARPHQRERSPHHLVRRRQHAADSRRRRAFLRAGRSAQQRVLAGRRGRGATCGPKPACAPRAPPPARSIRRNIAIPARRPAGCSPPRRPAPDGMRAHPLRQSGDRRRRHADARLLRRAPRQGHADAPEARDLERVCLVVAGEGRSTVGDRDLRMVAARRVHRSALDLRAPRGARRRRRPLHGDRQVRVRAPRPGAGGDGVAPS